MPSNASEALVIFDKETQEVVHEFPAKSKDPPVAKALFAVLASVGVFVFSSLINIYYVESMGGKISSSQKEKAESDKHLYDQHLR